MHTNIHYKLKEFYSYYDKKEINSICKKYGQVDLFKLYIKYKEENNPNKDLIFVSILKKFEKVIKKRTNNSYTEINSYYIEDYFSHFIFELESRIVKYEGIGRSDRKIMKDMLENNIRLNVYQLIKSVLYIAHYKTILDYEEGIKKEDIGKGKIKMKTFYGFINGDDEKKDEKDIFESDIDIKEDHYEKYMIELFIDYSIKKGMKKKTLLEEINNGEYSEMLLLHLKQFKEYIM